MKIFQLTFLFTLILHLTLEAATCRVTILGGHKISEGYELWINNERLGLKSESVALEKEFSVEEPISGIIRNKKGKFRKIWIEPGTIEIRIIESLNFFTLEVKGSKSQQILQNLESASSFDNFMKAFEENESHITALTYLNERYSAKWSNEQLVTIVSLLEEEDLNRAPEFLAYYKTKDLRKIEVGEQIIDFTAKDQNGNTFSTQDARGQYLLIDIAATGCLPCWKAFPYMIEEIEKYDNLQTITFNYDLQIKAWNNIAKRNNIEIPWPVLWYSDNKEEIFLRYKISSYPNYFLIDPDGMVVERWNFANKKMLKRKLKKHLK